MRIAWVRAGVGASSFGNYLCRVGQPKCGEPRVAFLISFSKQGNSQMHGCQPQAFPDVTIRVTRRTAAGIGAMIGILNIGVSAVAAFPSGPPPITTACALSA